MKERGIVLIGAGRAKFSETIVAKIDKGITEKLVILDNFEKKESPKKCLK